MLLLVFRRGVSGVDAAFTSSYVFLSSRGQKALLLSHPAVDFSISQRGTRTAPSFLHSFRNGIRTHGHRSTSITCVRTALSCGCSQASGLPRPPWDFGDRLTDENVFSENAAARIIHSPDRPLVSHTCGHSPSALRLRFRPMCPLFRSPSKSDGMLSKSDGTLLATVLFIPLRRPFFATLCHLTVPPFPVLVLCLRSSAARFGT